MIIQKNISLKHHNTFGISEIAKKFVKINSIEELQLLLSKDKDIFILGGGSNMLLTKPVEKLVIHLCLKGIKTVPTNNPNEILVTAKAGENWHEFVLWCISNNYGGLENLSLIPGNVGASPIQNIGAYGVEIKDTFYCLEALEIKTGILKTFYLKDCDFGYRNSIFKNQLKGNYVITSVTFKLTIKNHQINSSYGAIRTELGTNTNPTIKDISDAVIKIRNSKLPDPKEIGNSGSFFKNPVVSKAVYEKLAQDYPNMPSYKISETEYKIPAGWLIEQCGFKGKRFGNAGVHHKQALVLVNFGGATGIELYELAKIIRKKIKDQFSIALEIEVNVF